MSLRGFLKSSDAKGNRDMKTLYISDLDGTLLSSDALLSEKSREALRHFSSRGILISAATARTAATVSHILADGIERPRYTDERRVHVRSLGKTLC